MNRLVLLVAVLATLAVGCDGDGSNLPTSLPDGLPTSIVTTTEGGDTTTTEAGGETTTTAAETTTTEAEAATTTAPPETTTTGAETTTTEGSEGQALAKSEAIEAGAPDGWTVTVTDALSEPGTDLAGRLLTVCTLDRLDGSNLDDASLAAYSTLVEAPPSLFDPLFPSQASFDTRVFESDDAAGRAFLATEAVIRRADGRSCLATEFLSWILDVLPIDADAQLRVEDVAIPGANFGARIVWTVTVRDRRVDLFVDVVGHLSGDCTVVGAFVSVEQPFPPLIAADLLAAGISA